ncbi:MAG TPA: ribonuclease J, partial [Vampirovibrionales bacterium]
LGRSCWVFEQDNEIIVIDAGIGFVPHGFSGGVDYVLPNIDYLKKNKDKIQAIIISNPHEEYAANLCNLATELEVKSLVLPPILKALHQKQFSADTEVTTLEHNQEISIGKSFSLIPFQVSFSTVDAFSLLVKTSTTSFFYTGPFKIDHAPPIRTGRYELQTISNAITESGVDILISSSSNVESPGYTGSESSVIGKLTGILEQAKGRVFALTCSSYTHRLKVLLDAAIKTNRKVCLLGHEIEDWYSAAVDCGYLKYDKKLFISKDEIEGSKLKPEEILIIVGSLEGDVLKPFVQLSYKEHPEASLKEGDTIFISANPPLGTTRMLANAVDQLFLLGVTVIGGRDSGVHVNGYASQEELKFLYNVARPKYFVPSHGESRHLVLHAELIAKAGIDPKNAIIIDNGCVVDFDPPKDKIEVSGKVPFKSIFFNKQLDGEMGHQHVEERRSLSEDGTLTLALAVDLENGQVVSKPQIALCGCSYDRNSAWPEVKEKIETNIINIVSKALQQGKKDVGSLRHLIHDILNRALREKYGMSRPLISIVIQDVKN